MTPRPITRAGPVAAPFSYVLGQQEGFTPKTVSAVFDGAGASGAFLPCLSFYTQDGKLLARNFPSNTSIAVGSKAEVTYHPFLSGNSSTALPGQVIAIWNGQLAASNFSTSSTTFVASNYPANPTFTKQSATSALGIYGMADFTTGTAPDTIFCGAFIDGANILTTGVHVSIAAGFITAVIAGVQGFAGTPVPPFSAGAHTITMEIATQAGNPITLRSSTSVNLTIVEFEPGTVQ